mgnify:CR=1 FL=1
MDNSKKASVLGEVPVGCVIVKDDVVIGKGHNQVVKNNDPTCHGEMMAIHKACKKINSFDLSGCVIYTTGQPCPMCLAAILWANIDKVYYGCNIIDTEDIGFRDNLIRNNSLVKFALPMLDKCILYVKINHVVG